MTENDRMSRGGNLALCVVMGALLSACATPYSEAPIPTNFPTTKQLELQAASHWNNIAEDAADTIASSLKAGKGCIAPTPACNLVYVREISEMGASGTKPAPFARAFRTQFITSLVNKGMNVAKTPTAGAVEIEFDIQMAKFRPKRPTGTFVSATAITGGVWALHGTWEHASPGAAVALASLAFDVNRWMSSELAAGPTPQREVIVTVSASNANRYIGRVTNVYYIADPDERLYRTAPPTITVKGGE